MKNDSKRSPFRRLTQFSLRSLLVAMMLVAVYIAGWMSHRSWNRRNVEETISRAVEEADLPVKVEFIEGTDVFMSRGRKEDVDKAMQVIDKVNEAARQ